MSFSAQTKTELCAIPVSRDCCAVAEAYGLLLFAHTFSHTEIAQQAHHFAAQRMVRRRQLQIETANLIKASNAAAEQIAVIHQALNKGGWEIFPDAMHATIRLRLEHPEMSLTELAAQSQPPLSKPGMSHRLKRIVAMAKAAVQEEHT